MDLRKKSSLSLFFENDTIFWIFFANSEMKLSIGLKSPLRPLAKMCARYLESLDKRESAYLGESAKCLMMARSRSYKSD